MLHPKLRIEQRVSLLSIFWSGGVAEWLGSGLQSRVRRFDSGPRLKKSQIPVGSVGLVSYEASGRLAQLVSALA